MFKIFLTFFIVSTLCFAYENQKGKIDMHGGKSNSLLNSKGFSNAIGLFGDDKQKLKKEKKEENKDFIEIESIEKIESKGTSK